ncbi:ATP-binding cassette domain-containing protein [Saccharopolyspora sp. WRP15-2]|uniref:ATP-binding cassette domain-containing protein n=1 Tax=Saccharopolyspora oryzae TaxID=2997343 RepID=A0ABT4V339_9PSEU|nr:ATP-binding cassette domain-containing protein [Saccharopolyspora oryzae]MDA3628233.1 ATP-binding cassette domain-containing protein [Saccharopolyspora oryzae]
MTEELAVCCEGLRHRFGDTVAVDGVDLRIVSGEVFGLLGPNGAGKTTTIRMIATLLPAAPGAIEVFGVDVNRRKLAARRLIGYVPQQLSADSALTGRENVELFARLFDVPRAQRRDAVDAALRSVGLDDVAERTAATYSGGMVRRLELAQALVSAPRLLVLDEPTIGLDPIARAGVWERIDEVRAATGMTVLVTTHYMEEADRQCDRVALMHRGRIHREGTPLELRTEVGPEATLEDAFRAVTGDALGESTGEGMRDVRAARRVARRVG